MSIKEKISDRPILHVDQDEFNIKERVVNPLYKMIQQDKIKPCTVALMGEWGCGKTSVLNLLQQELNYKNNIVINFDPILEGKFEIHELIERFLLKLHSSMSSDIGEHVKKAIKSLILLSRCNLSVSGGIGGLSAGIPVEAKAGVGYNLEKNVDDIIKLWQKEDPQLFSEKIASINVALKERPLYLIIDEIDRLPSKLILKFLIFTRTLEIFDNLICIVALDYTRVTQKFITEQTLGYADYDSATSYIDKLFQPRFDVCNTLNIDKSVKYVIKKLHLIFSEECIKILENDLNSDINKLLKFQEIVGYLSTLRNINKWLMNLIKNADFISNVDNKLEWLSFIALFSKHPLILDNLIRHAGKVILNNTFYSLNRYVDAHYGVKFDDNTDDNDIYLAFLGINNDDDNIDEKKQKSFVKLSKKVCKCVITDKQTAEFATSFIKIIPNSKYQLSLFILGWASEDLSLFRKFFDEDVNIVLEQFMCDSEKSNDLLAHDISQQLYRGGIVVKNQPKIDLLNTLWCDKISVQSNLLGNPYGTIIYSLLKVIPIEKIISDALLSLSEDYLGMLLAIFGIKNKDGNYDFSQFKNPDGAAVREKQFEPTTFNGKSIDHFNEEIMRKIIQSWLDKTEQHFVNDKNNLFANTKEQMSIFYRYVQWSRMLGLSNSERKLAEKAQLYLENNKVSDEHKKQTIEAIGQECCRYTQREFGINKNPVFNLFDGNADLIQVILKTGKQFRAKYLSDIEQAYNNKK
ncbi:MAG: P-loop NTPase fold protein [Gammaproteobacteria bacterium]